mgnify:CR=1 FL=1
MGSKCVYQKYQEIITTFDHPHLWQVPGFSRSLVSVESALILSGFEKTKR